MRSSTSLLVALVPVVVGLWASGCGSQSSAAPPGADAGGSSGGGSGSSSGSTGDGGVQSGTFTVYSPAGCAYSYAPPSTLGFQNLAYDDSLIGLIATDRNSAHLAEQIAVKAFFPLIALSSDHTLTSTNIPWIKRLAPPTPVRDAVDVFVDAVQKAGPNREKVRDYLTNIP